MKRRLFLSVIVGCFLTAACFGGGLSWKEPMQSGLLHNDIEECSGLAASRGDGKILWAHNDSGNEPLLYAMEPNGTLRGRVRVEGVMNNDWEDLASFVLDGKSYLLIADTGNNAGKRGDCALLIIEEPAVEKLSPFEELRAEVAWKIPVTYFDGEHDCEAVTVDAAEGFVYLVTKRTRVPMVCRVPLRWSGTERAVAEKVGVVSNVPQPNMAQRMQPVATGRYRASVTGLDFSTDGRLAVVLTYGDVLVFERKGGEAWGAAFARKPRRLGSPKLRQAEAVCFAQDGRTIYVSSEGLNAPVLRYRFGE